MDVYMHGCHFQNRTRREGSSGESLNGNLVEILERSRRFVRTENHDLLR